MLTRELGIVNYERGRALPDRLTAADAERYAAHALKMLNVYRLGVGSTREELHRSVQGVLAGEPDCPANRIKAFCKLLDSVSEYDSDPKGRSAALRQKVFRLAAAYHPLVRTSDRLFEHEEESVKERIAVELKTPWTEIDRDLFADVMEFQRLRTFAGYPDGAALVDRYNVAQVQTALFDAVKMTVWAFDDFKTILRYAKLARLMHRIQQRRVGEYELQFDGPASVLRETRRYGVAMARFLPALIACRGWRMQALLQTPRKGWYVRLDLSPQEGYRSHLPGPEEFDSSFEEAFARRWGEEKRDGWSLVREGEILHHSQKVFIPDFSFQHEDGRCVPLEIVGFWTPEYLQAKLDTLKAFAGRSILLAVAEGVGTHRPDLPADVIRFKTALKVDDVLERLRTKSDKCQVTSDKT